jgi:hypothetical protein
MIVIKKTAISADIAKKKNVRMWHKIAGMRKVQRHDERQHPTQHHNPASSA